MWLLPSSLSRCSPVAAGSTLGLRRVFASSLLWRGEPFAESDPSPTSSERPTPPQSFSRAWRRARWLQALFGRMLPPSTAPAFEAWWTSSLVEARAKTSALPASGADSTAPSPASSGTSRASSRSASPGSSSGRTSAARRASSRASSTPSPSEATEAPPSPFALLTLERRTAGDASSCWPTATAERAGSNSGGERPGPKRPSLETLGRQWPTATATDSRASGAAAYSTDSGRHAGTTLTDAAVRAWSTPRASDGAKGSPNQRQRGTPPLSAQAHGATGRQGLETSTPGSASESSGQTSFRLNPAFVEWLMGWPAGWTMTTLPTPGQTGFDFSETASSQPRRRSHFRGSPDGYL